MPKQLGLKIPSLKYYLRSSVQGGRRAKRCLKGHTGGTRSLGFTVKVVSKVPIVRIQ